MPEGKEGVARKRDPLDLAGGIGLGFVKANDDPAIRGQGVKRIHLERVASHYQTTPDALCMALAAATGDRVATVDVVIWRACNLGIVNSRELKK